MITPTVGRVAVAPRVTLDDIKASTSAVYHFTADEALHQTPVAVTHYDALKTLSLCLIVMRNGYTVIGKSAPASPDNFNAELGRELAYEDAVRQVWPLMGFALRDRLHKEARA